MIDDINSLEKYYSNIRGATKRNLALAIIANMRLQNSTEFKCSIREISEQINATQKQVKSVINDLWGIAWMSPFVGEAAVLLKQGNLEDIDFERIAQQYNSKIKKLEAMKEYIFTKDCLKNVINNYFGEANTEGCGTCYNCNPFYSFSPISGQN